MCTELVAQCDWCLFRRHISWDECRDFLELRKRHVERQIYPMPRPENNCEGVMWRKEHGISFMSARVAVKIQLGACPSSACLSEIFDAIMRKKQARRAVRRHRRVVQHIETVRSEKDAWVRENCSRVPVRRPSGISLLSLGLREQQQQNTDDSEGS
ncbi:hypothetical protein ACRE_036630 [Hapsidospora chrysogenum ATCC 11550]|uniref:Uncharacterized protein n=1 Tax=Hapsidospora chrysogenum (strain ATCC 11550 / CBS 779.69 / DSM 880 / IAM 14645 / JCM 23072 / IMI 49137) TaxID=857340 RepID=A0A086T837_HAPC1|nr:hypothetical protein ACRE_036630 [Hapsidospora chrysogenum ATCC 11550]